MQLKATLAAGLAALAMGVNAQEPTITSISPDVQHSVLLVLATAIPSESVSYAIASESAFASEMASSLSAGNTPAWYQSLPADVKSLLPVIYFVDAATTTSGSGNLSSSATPTPSSATVRSSASTTPSQSAPPQQSTNAAALPTAALGAVAGVFLGMLAL